MSSVPQPFVQNALHRYADATKSTNDMISLLDYVDVSDLRSFVHQQIDKMAPSKAHAAFYSLSLNHIIPNDILQLILSFESPNHHRRVCKQWNQLNIQREEQRLNAIHKSITTRFPATDPSTTSLSNERLYPTSGSNQKNKRERTIWILHSKRDRLHPLEKRLKYRFLQKLQSVKESDWSGCDCPRSGDIVLVHDGSYRRDGMSRLSKDIKFVGVSASPLATPPFFCRGNTPIFHGKVLLENLFIGKVIVKGTKGNVVMRHCTVRSVIVEEGASLDIRECVITKRGYTPGDPAIDVSPIAKKVVISNNKFMHYKRCVDIRTAYGRGDDVNKDNMVHITIQDNVLENVDGLLPFSEFVGDYRTTNPLFATQEANDHVVIRGNSVFPESTDLQHDTKVANMLHCVDAVLKAQLRGLY